MKVRFFLFHSIGGTASAFLYPDNGSSLSVDNNSSVYLPLAQSSLNLILGGPQYKRR